MSHMVRFKAITLSSFSRRVSSSVRPALNNETATCQIVSDIPTRSGITNLPTLNKRMGLRHFIQRTHQDFAVLDEVADMIFHDRERLRSKFVRRDGLILAVRSDDDVPYLRRSSNEQSVPPRVDETDVCMVRTDLVQNLFPLRGLIRLAGLDRRIGLLEGRI